MGVREHGSAGQVVRHGREAGDDFVEGRQHDFVARRLQHQRVAQVVDVFGSAREVDELGDLRDLGVARETFLQEVLDGLDVVIGARLYGLDLGAVGFGEAADDRVERFERGGGELRYFLDGRFGGERFEPFDFDQHAVADEAELAEIRSQRFDFAAVAPVERR